MNGLKQIREILSKLKIFINLFNKKEINKLDKISDYYHNLSKKNQKINKKIG